MIYMICEDFFNDVEKKIKRIAKKCARNGNDFTYRVIGETFKEVGAAFVEDGKAFTTLYKMIIIEVEGTAKIDNWEFIATLEYHDGGNVIRKFNTDIEVPERFWHTEDFCEHCGMKRNRNNLYIIHNVETDEWKQVGKNCLMQYTGGLNAEYVAAYMDGITMLEENDGYIGGGNGVRYYPLDEVLAYAVEVIDKTGYRNAEFNLPTRMLVSNMIGREALSNKIARNNRLLNDYGFGKYEFSKSDFFKDGTANRVQKIIDYWKNLDSDTEFNRNIKAIIADGCLNTKNLGFVCYMPEGYNRNVLLEERKRMEKETEINDYFGNVGDRVKDAAVKYIKVLATYETQYGINQVCKIVLEDGKVFYWTGKGIDYYRWNGSEDVEIVPVKISFTIKEHGMYKGTKQTKVTRCKVTYRDVEKSA